MTTNKKHLLLTKTTHMKDQLLHFIERAEGDIAFLSGKSASDLDKALAEHLIEYVAKLKEIAQ